jgi:hypothetical protein
LVSFFITASLRLHYSIAALIFMMHCTIDCSLSPDFTFAYCAKFDKRNPIKSLTLDSQVWVCSSNLMHSSDWTEITFALNSIPAISFAFSSW